MVRRRIKTDENKDAGGARRKQKRKSLYACIHMRFENVQKRYILASNVTLKKVQRLSKETSPFTSYNTN